MTEQNTTGTSQAVEHEPDVIDTTGGLERMFQDQPPAKDQPPVTDKDASKTDAAKADAGKADSDKDGTIVAKHDQQERHYVPLKKYVALERQYKAQKQYLEGIDTRIQERFEQFKNELSKPREELPDKTADPVAYLVAKQEQLERQQQQARAQESQDQQQDSERQELLSYAKYHAGLWREEHPDYSERLDRLQATFNQEAVEQGYSPQEAARRGGELAMEIIKFAKKFDLNPARFYHALADTIGPEGPDTAQESTTMQRSNANAQKTDAQKMMDGQASAKTLGGTSPAASRKGNLTFKDLESMPNNEERARLMDELISKELGRPHYK